VGFYHEGVSRSWMSRHGLREQEACLLSGIRLIIVNVIYIYEQWVVQWVNRHYFLRRAF
jgi:hypothetical protein